MHTDEAFDIFQRKIDAAAYHVRKARHRRDIFCHALKTLKDVTEAFPSGSLARGTQLDPIHDVDLIAVFDQAAHPDWGEEGDSAAEALGYAQEKVKGLLGDWGSPTRHVVGETLLRNHVVKCFLEPRFLAEDKGFSGWFAVEVMPVLRDPRDGVLLIPERRSQRWQKADPEWLIAEVARRQNQWHYLIRTLRLLKFWSIHVKTGMKSLAVEVLALECLPDPAPGELSRSEALLRFFTAASAAVMLPIKDPAGYCGKIQLDLNRVKISALLSEAADIAADAVAWERLGEHHKAICCWRMIFGPRFPVPPGGCPGQTDEDAGDDHEEDSAEPPGESGKPPRDDGESNGNDPPDSREPPGDTEPPGGKGPPGNSGTGGPSGKAPPDGSPSGSSPGRAGPANGVSGVGGAALGGSYERPRSSRPSPSRPVTDAPQGKL